MHYSRKHRIFPSSESHRMHTFESEWESVSENLKQKNHPRNISTLRTRSLDIRYSQLGGVILHSALLSGGSTFMKSNVFRMCDPFDNSQNSTMINVLLDGEFDVVSHLSYSWNEG